MEMEIRCPGLKSTEFAKIVDFDSLTRIVIKNAIEFKNEIKS